MTVAHLPLAVDHVCIGVPDIDEAIDWYERVLGFEVDVQWTVPELVGFRLAYIRRGAFRIELIDSGSNERTSVAPMSFEQFLRVRGFNHVCFRVDDVDEVAEGIREEGVSFELDPTDFPDVGRRVAFFRDPFGNYLELAGPLAERSEP